MKNLGSLFSSLVTAVVPGVRKLQRAEYERVYELATWRTLYCDQSPVVRAFMLARIEHDAREEDRSRYEAACEGEREAHLNAARHCLRAVGLSDGDAEAVDLLHADALREDAERFVRRAAA